MWIQEGGNDGLLFDIVVSKIASSLTWHYHYPPSKTIHVDKRVKLHISTESCTVKLWLLCGNLTIYNIYGRIRQSLILHDVISPEYLGNSRQLTQLCRQKCHVTSKVPAEITHQTRETIYCPRVLSPFSQSRRIVCLWGVWEEHIFKEPLNYSTRYVCIAYSIYVCT